MKLVGRHDPNLLMVYIVLLNLKMLFRFLHSSQLFYVILD